MQQQQQQAAIQAQAMQGMNAQQMAGQQVSSTIPCIRMRIKCFFAVKRNPWETRSSNGDCIWGHAGPAQYGVRSIRVGN